MCSDAPFKIYNISYLYYTMVGALITITVALIVSFCMGFNGINRVDPKLLSPFVRRWLERRKTKKAVVPSTTDVKATNGNLQKIQETKT